MFSQCKSMGPWTGPFLNPGAWLAEIIKRTTTHCYIQNIKALGLVVSETLSMFFSMTPPGRGLYGPLGYIKMTIIHCSTQT